MASLRIAIFAIAAWSGVVSAAAMDLSSSAEIPESSEVLGWYGSLSTAPGRIADFSVCLDPSAYADGDCSKGSPRLDDGLVAGASLGYSFRGGFRLEGEMTQRHNDHSISADARDPLGVGPAAANELSLMLNGVYDFDTRTPLTPFIGAGLGGVRIDQQDPALIGEGFDFNTEDSSWKLGVQGFAGLQYEFSPELKLGIRYSHKLVKTNNTSNFDSGVDTGSDGIKNRALMLTLTYEFGGP
jgi:opacity protein-like surface antigen